MKRFLIAFTFLIAASGFSQNMERDRTIEATVDRLANQYDNQLAMTAEQFLLFKNELKATLKTRELIEQRYSGKEKLDQLALMQNYETAAMGEILTRIQLRKYKQIKPELQPLAIVKQP